MTRTPLAAPVKLVVLFVLMSGVPLATLGWLGWRVLQQDRALEAQRVRDQLDSAATLLARELDRDLTALDDLLPAAARGDAVNLPAGGVFLFFDDRGLLRRQGVAIPYYPRIASIEAPPDGTFAAAEANEFRDRNLPSAIAAYRRLASSSDPIVRSAALMRLARSLRKQQRLREALATYGELASMGGTIVAGSPSELVARRERIVLLKASGDSGGAAREAGRIAAALADGRFVLDRSTFEFFKEATPDGEWTKSAAVDRIRLSDAMAGFWPLLTEQPAGREARTIDGRSFVAVWRRLGDRTAAVVSDATALPTLSAGMTRSPLVRVVLEDRTGLRSSPAGDFPGSFPTITKTFRETGLPWTMHVAMHDPSAGQAITSSRQRLLAAGFGLMVVVIVVAAHVVFRAVNRELGVARLQSDFVAAVSHEFRTPLTAMCHLTEMLDDGSAPPDRVRAYYAALAKESRRLHAMVERLLDFGRIESGRRTYELIESDATALVSDVVRDFREQASASAHRLELQHAAGSAASSLRIRADREALGLALRNLLDNAVKYSPESSPVRISVAAEGSFVRICVEDEGPGIPKHEQREIFRKFARGTAAQSLNVKGTGIGLAMAQQIVQAHGGRLELVSEPGRGTRFMTLIPSAQAS